LKHDLICINISDQREVSLPKRGLFALRDVETGEDFFINLSDPGIREGFSRIMKQNESYLEGLFKKFNIDYINIRDEENFEKPLFDFFLKRRKKFSK
jgi:hypothetical protein